MFDAQIDSKGPKNLEYSARTRLSIKKFVVLQPKHSCPSFIILCSSPSGLW